MVSTPPTAPAPVPFHWLERHWAAITARTSDPLSGIFGPASISWRINRESALFLGAGRAALLQLAHPWVAAALDHHSSLRTDPLARFHKTFRIIFTMIFGTLEQALAASRYLYRLHTGVEGEIPEAVARYSAGTRYQANEVNALLWVYATLVESALLAYECVLPRLTDADREAYYAESKTMAALFGIPFEALPKDWVAFEVYTSTMAASNALGVNHLSRELAYAVLHGTGSWVPIPRWYRSLTASWLPENLRGQFGLEFDVRDQTLADRAQRWLPRVYRTLPSAVRFVGPYREANARLLGRRTGPLIQASNRFWIGQPRIISRDLGS